MLEIFDYIQTTFSILFTLSLTVTSPVAQTVKRLPTMPETQVQSLGRENLLEKEMATHSQVFLPGKSHGWRSLVGYSPKGGKESDTSEPLPFHFVQLLSLIFLIW